MATALSKPLPPSVSLPARRRRVYHGLLIKTTGLTPWARGLRPGRNEATPLLAAEFPEVMSLVLLHFLHFWQPLLCICKYNAPSGTAKSAKSATHLPWRRRYNE